MAALRALPRLQSMVADELTRSGAVDTINGRRGEFVLDSLAGSSPRRLARIAGALYLVNIVAGAFAIGLVPSTLHVSDVATTAHNIQAHELLYRLGLAAHVVVTLTNVPMAVIFYSLLRVVNRKLALLDVFFTLVATAIEAAGLLNQFTPLLLLSNGRYTSALPAAQLQALAYLPGDLATIDYSIYGIFYGLDILCVAYLVYKSGFLPRAIGVLLAIDSLAYLLYGFAEIVAPGFAAHLLPWTEVPAPVGEGSLCLWLLVVGLNVERWNRRASAARGELVEVTRPRT